MPQGNYDHPTYLARNVLKFLTIAGANGTSGACVLPWAINVHQMSAVVVTAGTSATTGAQVQLLSGTTSVTSSTIALNTQTAGVSGTTGDLATVIPAGTLISIKNGTDATCVANVTVEYNISPSATWVGTE